MNASASKSTNTTDSSPKETEGKLTFEKGEEGKKTVTVVRNGQTFTATISFLPEAALRFLDLI